MTGTKLQKPLSPLANLLKARSITQIDLARMVGLTQEHLSRIENGKAQLAPDMQARIATILGSTAETLFPEQAAQ